MPSRWVSIPLPDEINEYLKIAGAAPLDDTTPATDTAT